LRLDAVQAALQMNMEPQLVADLLREFKTIRNDVLTSSVGRAAPGKFIETLVQLLQWIEARQYDAQPSVDAYLRRLESRSSAQLPDSLRLLAARCGRFVYGLRSKRGIAHKGEIDPNVMDLRVIYSCCQWLVAELVRLFHGVKAEEAHAMIDFLTLPPVPLIEDFGDHVVVLNRSKSVTNELLIILHHYYPNQIPLKQIYCDAKRRNKRQIGGGLGVLYKDALIEGSAKEGYKLTRTGLNAAFEVLRSAEES
jgi:hypothetical protein